MTEKIHPIDKEASLNDNFAKVLVELQYLRGEVAELRAGQTAMIEQLSSRPTPAQPTSQPENHRQKSKHDTKLGGMDLANELYKNRSSNHKSNFVHVDRIFNEHSAFLEPLMTACPRIKNIVSHILTNNFGWSVKSVDTTTPMIHFTEEDCQRIATALAFFLRKRKTAEVALEVSERNARNCKNHNGFIIHN